MPSKRGHLCGGNWQENLGQTRGAGVGEPRLGIFAGPRAMATRRPAGGLVGTADCVPQPVRPKLSPPFADFSPVLQFSLKTPHLPCLGPFRPWQRSYQQRHKSQVPRAAVQTAGTQPLSCLLLRSPVLNGPLLFALGWVRQGLTYSGPRLAVGPRAGHSLPTLDPSRRKCWFTRPLLMGIWLVLALVSWAVKDELKCPAEGAQERGVTDPAEPLLGGGSFCSLPHGFHDAC